MRNLLYVLLGLLVFFSLCTVVLFNEEKRSDAEIISIANEVIKKYPTADKDLIVIVDYSNNLLSRRFYLIDLRKQSIVLKSRVSHAFNSGELYPNSFSNEIGSEKSSLGVYITAGQYSGKYGNSIKLAGLSIGLNTNALNRAVVIHSSDKWDGLPCYSKGCFVVDKEIKNILLEKISKNNLIYAIKD